MSFRCGLAFYYLSYIAFGWIRISLDRFPTTNEWAISFEFVPHHIWLCIVIVPGIGVQGGVAVLPYRIDGRSRLHEYPDGLFVIVAARQVQGRVLILVPLVNRILPWELRVYFL